VVAFNASLKKKDDDALKQTWAIISALSLFLNEVQMGAFIGNEDGDKVAELSGLMGFALIRALAALDHAEKLKADTTFIDVPIVITSFLEWSSDLPAYGIDDDAVDWRSHAAAYFKKAGFDNEKGIATTAKLIEEAEPSAQEELAKKSDKDPWKWSKRLKDYKSNHGPKIGGTKYDITKMSRKERASYAFDHKDPLADISDKDLKEGNLDFA
jgi:predicted KAP-like P-loop ATPase